MVVHARRIHYPRQGDPITPPTVSGINGAVTLTTTDIRSTGLVFDTTAGAGSNTPPPFAPSPTPDPSPTGKPDVAPPPSPSPSTSAVNASSKTIAMSTVIGTCIGAFIGASGLILLGLWVYRRYSQSLKKRANSRGPLIHARNMQNNEQRRRSRLEPWNKLEDADDKWEGMYQTKETKEVDQVAPMEKLTMFKKTPSVRTAYTHKSTDASNFHFPQSFAPFDPDLAASLNAGAEPMPMPQPRPFLGRSDTAPAASLEGDESYLSVHSRVSGGAMSPSLHMAIPTPPPTISQLHRWESAEVVHYSEAQSAEVVNPFDEDNRKSQSNPFFNAQDYEVHHGRSRSRSSSVHSRSRSRSNSRSRSAAAVKSDKAKGKERMRYSNATTATNATDPFDDINEHMPMRPTFMQHVQTSSTSSMDKEEKERALQSLIAALEVPEEEVRNRLRIASMQPSVISQASTIGGFDADVTREFPLPPNGSGRRS